jgi:GT2 family glycosyltransferase
MAEDKAANGRQQGTADMPVSVLSGLVSIIVPCCGQLEYTKLCLASVLRHSREPFELICLDIGSLDGTAEYLAGVAAAAKVPVEVVRSETDLDLGEAVRDALGRAKGEYIVLLNNDTIVTDAWLNQLIGLSNLSPAIGLAGPMSNYAAPPQLVETVPYRIGAKGERRGARSGGRGLRAEGRGEEALEEVNIFAREWRERQRGKWLEVERLGGFCLLLKRVVLTRIGRDLTEWSDLSLFDTDILSAKARQAGFTLACCRDLFIHHFGTRTFAHGAPAWQNRPADTHLA